MQSIRVEINLLLQLLPITLPVAAGWQHCPVPSCSSHTALCPAGHQCHRAGLPAPAAHGLPSCPAPTDAGLLAEGPQHPASLRRDCQHPGQNDPQPGKPQNCGYHHRCVSPRAWCRIWPSGGAGIRELYPHLNASLSPSRPSQPLLDRSIPDFTAFTSVEDWLSAVKMSQYRDNFLSAGFTSLQLVAQMTSE